MSFLPLVLCAFLAFLWMKGGSRKHPPLPPGPPPDPFIGHARKVPSEHQDGKFYEWGKVYGDVLYLNVLGRSIVVLNSVKAAVDLLENRSGIYSDRPRFVVFELMGWVRTATFTGYGKVFQKHRRMFQEHLNPKKSNTYHPIQTQEAHILLQKLATDDSNRDDYLRRFSTAIIMRVAFGHQVTSDNDPYLDIMDDVSRAVTNAGSPGGTLVDLFPLFAYLPSWFPGTYYATFARNHRKTIDMLHDYPFEQTKKEMEAGIAKPSFLSSIFSSLRPEEAEDPENILNVKGAAGVLYCAGAETTWSTLSIFFLAMTLHPECQKRAQEEIDTVIGTQRLPGFSDRESLPYVEYILQETLRWNSAVPLGIPHRSLEDDIYRDMFIPKGSIIIANTKAMNLEESIYAEPHHFNPSRYLPQPEGNNEPYPKAPFGFGRRICPGQYLAHSSLWIAMATTLATLDVAKARGSSGEEITPEVSFSSGISSQPNSYECRIRPRNDKARGLIMHADVSDNY